MGNRSFDHETDYYPGALSVSVSEFLWELFNPCDVQNESCFPDKWNLILVNSWDLTSSFFCYN